MIIKREPEEKDRAEELAKRLGEVIPGDLSIVMWSLPILEALLKKVEELEARRT